MKPTLQAIIQKRKKDEFQFNNDDYCETKICREQYSDYSERSPTHCVFSKPDEISSDHRKCRGYNNNEHSPKNRNCIFYDCEENKSDDYNSINNINLIFEYINTKTSHCSLSRIILDHIRKSINKESGHNSPRRQ